jgi:hypothetical protein
MPKSHPTLKNVRYADSYTVAEQKAINDALEAAGDISKTFGTWMIVARGVLAIHEHAQRIGHRQAFQHCLKESGIAPYLGNTWNSQFTTASKLMKILARLPEVERWREGLTPHQRLSWVAPTTIYLRCPLFKAEPKLDEHGNPILPKKRKPKDDALLDENQDLKEQLAEATRNIDELEARQQELDEELAATKQQAREAAPEFTDAGGIPDFLRRGSEPAAEMMPVAQADATMAIHKAWTEKLEAEIAELKSKVSAAPVDESEASATMRKLQAEIDDLKAEIEALNAENTEIKAKFVMLSDDLKNLLTEAEANKQEKTKLKNTAAVLTAKLHDKYYAATSDETARKLYTELLDENKTLRLRLGLSLTEIVEPAPELMSQAEPRVEAIEEPKKTSGKRKKTLSWALVDKTLKHNQIVAKAYTADEYTVWPIQPGLSHEACFSVRCGDEELGSGLTMLKAKAIALQHFKARQD